jgi:hypothetical protein
MDALSTWEMSVIVVGGTVITSISVLLLGLALMVLLGWWTGVQEPPVFVVAGKVVRYFRHRLARRPARTGSEPVHSDPAASAPSGSFAPTYSNPVGG